MLESPWKIFAPKFWLWRNSKEHQIFSMQNMLMGSLCTNIWTPGRPFVFSEIKRCTLFQPRWQALCSSWRHSHKAAKYSVDACDSLIPRLSDGWSAQSHSIVVCRIHIGFDGLTIEWLDQRLPYFFERSPNLGLVNTRRPKTQTTYEKKTIVWMISGIHLQCWKQTRGFLIRSGLHRDRISKTLVFNLNGNEPWPSLRSVIGFEWVRRHH